MTVSLYAFVDRQSGLYRPKRVIFMGQRRKSKEDNRVDAFVVHLNVQYNAFQPRRYSFNLRVNSLKRGQEIVAKLNLVKTYLNYGQVAKFRQQKPREVGCALKNDGR